MENQTSGNMPRKSFGKRIAYIWLPFIIYWVISIGVNFIAITILYAKDFVERQEVYIDAMQNQELMMKLAMELVEKAVNYTLLIQVAIAAVAIPFFFWMYRSDRKKEIKLGIAQSQPAKLSKYGYAIGIAVTMSIALNNFINLSGVQQYSQEYEEVQSVFFQPDLGVQLLSLGVLMPVAEELLFRGVMYKRLRQDTAVVPALIYMSMVFGLTHGNLVQLIYGILMGLMLGYLCEKYGTIGAPILAHMAANAITIVFNYFRLYEIMLDNIWILGIATVACSTLSAVFYLAIRGINEKY